MHNYDNNWNFRYMNPIFSIESFNRQYFIGNWYIYVIYVMIFMETSILFLITCFQSFKLYDVI